MIVLPSPPRPYHILPQACSQLPKPRCALPNYHIRHLYGTVCTGHHFQRVLCAAPSKNLPPRCYLSRGQCSHPGWTATAAAAVIRITCAASSTSTSTAAPPNSQWKCQPLSDTYQTVLVEGSELLVAAVVVAGVLEGESTSNEESVVICCRYVCMI